MNVSSWLQIGLFLAVLVLLVKPLGWYMARVYEGKPCGLGRAVGWLERLIYRVCRHRPGRRNDVDRLRQGHARVQPAGDSGRLRPATGCRTFLPLNPQHMTAVPPDLAMNTAVSFATNTNWQNYGGETTLSYLTQMLGLTVQNFLSAATGMAILVAMIRGFVRRQLADDRQLLVRPGAEHAVYPDAAVDRGGPGAGFARGGPDVRALPESDADRAHQGRRTASR